MWTGEPHLYDPIHKVALTLIPNDTNHWVELILENRLVFKRFIFKCSNSLLTDVELRIVTYFRGMW